MDLDDDNDNNNNNTSDNNNSIGNGKGNINDNGNDNDGNAKASDSGVHQDGVVGDDAGWEMEESDSGSYALQLCFLSDALLQHLIFADCIGDRQLIKQLVSQGTVRCPRCPDCTYRSFCLPHEPSMHGCKCRRFHAQTISTISTRLTKGSPILPAWVQRSRQKCAPV